MGQAREAGLERSKFEAIASDFIESARLWGPRMELRADVDMGLFLSAHEYLPELSLEYLNRAEPNQTSGKSSIGITQ